MASERLRVGGDEIVLRVTGEQSRGALLAAEVRIPAGGGPPALHRHESEEVYRLEHGELTIYLEDDAGEVQRIRATPGAVVHVPGARAHTVRNESAAEARAYVVFAPGTEIEGFLRAVAAPAGERPSMAGVLALAERHGIEMAGPALAS